MLPTSFAFISKNAIPVILETKHMNNISISLIIVFILAEKVFFYFLQCLTFYIKHKSEKCE